jgi:hypothetical protein
MGITAARETLDAALGQKVQTAGGMALNHARSAAKRTGGDGLLYLRRGPAPIACPDPRDQIFAAKSKRWCDL